MQPYRYCVSILAAGGGSRFGNKSQYSHKALFRVGAKAVISHIIDLFPQDVTFVIALGYNGHLITQYLDMYHADRHFIYVTIPPGHYGPGYGPAYSMNCCRDHLQSPFYSFSCDTIVTGFVPDETCNWLGYSAIDREDASKFCTLQIDPVTRTVIAVLDKRVDGTENAWIGLAFIRDYASFWEAMDTNSQLINGELQLSPALFGLPDLRARRVFAWYDTGNERGLQRALRDFGGLDALAKVGEEIYFSSTDVLKFFFDKHAVATRVERAKCLYPVVPQIEAASDNFYRYRYVQGHDLTRIDRPDTHLPALLEYVRKYLWKDVELNTDQLETFRSVCRGFYYAKTLSRLGIVYELLGIHDAPCLVNGTSLPSLTKVLCEDIDWDWLCDGTPSTFHGDLNFANVICKDGADFALVDHRADFGGITEYGDRYYDLAKLYQSVIWPHRSVRSGQLSVTRTHDGAVNVNIATPDVIQNCKLEIERWAAQEGYDLRKVRLLATLTLLNIAPLHELPLCEHLYFLGRELLWRSVQENQGSIVRAGLATEEK